MTDLMLVRFQPGGVGRMAERSIAVVLKTTGCVPEGSNPSTPWLRGGMVDTLHLGCKRCGFESRRGHP
jgi:hypothetical protein